jgi:2-oxoglutarate dehydrogenase E1 component
MYKAIEQRRSVRKVFVESLVKRGAITIEEAEAALDDFNAKLQASLDQTRSTAPEPVRAARPPKALGVLPAVATGAPRELLDRVFASLTAYPDGFTVHPKLARQFEARARLYEAGEVEWATAELLAFGTLAYEGFTVRLAGEDSRRGTFSQRHATVTDYETGVRWTPLKHLPGAPANVHIYDSLLSEYAALGFEYGYSVANKEALVAWEAQFGDFVNGAQIIIDQFLAAAEDKWGQTSGLVLLLPHGFEGQGPEHSSARIERFLTLCAEDNIQVANATTAAQYFHLLRRQCVRDVRKPLVVLAPKQPLRMKESRSRVADLTQGSFRETLDDPGVQRPEAVTRVVLCSGKVAWDLLAERDRLGTPVAVVRVEQLYPWPEAQIEAILAGYPGTTEVVWAQEEPENMGPWPFVFHQLHPVANRYRLRVAARVASGSPATGSATIHKQELQDLLAEAVGPA